MHRKGRFRIHTGKWVIDKCVVCTDRAAQWERFPPEGAYEPDKLCLPCLREQYVEDPLDPEVASSGGLEAVYPHIQRMTYCGYSVLQHREKLKHKEHMKVAAAYIVSLSFYLLLLLCRRCL